jgi:hypothetical protein
LPENGDIAEDITKDVIKRSCICAADLNLVLFPIRICFVRLEAKVLRPPFGLFWKYSVIEYLLKFRMMHQNN